MRATRLSKLFDEDSVGLAQRFEPAIAHFAQATHGQSGSGKRMPPNHLLRQAEFEAELARFVLEQVTQGLDEFEPEFFRQSTDIVMGLDRRGRPVRIPAAFDDVGVQRPLS